MEAGVADGREVGWGERGAPWHLGIGMQGGLEDEAPVAGHYLPREQESEAACYVGGGSVVVGDIGWGLGRMGQVGQGKRVLKMLLGRKKKRNVRRWGMRSWTGK